MTQAPQVGALRERYFEPLRCARPGADEQPALLEAAAGEAGRRG